MNKTNWLIMLFASSLCFCCIKGVRYKTDGQTIKTGNQIFDTQCVACHNFKSSGIGPNLAGITEELSYEQLKDFINNPLKEIESGNLRAKELFNEYKTYMPDFNHLAEKDMEAILAYLHSNNEVLKNDFISEYGEHLQNPIPDSISNSGKTLRLEFVVQVPSTSNTKPLARINKISSMPESKRKFIHDLNGVLYELMEDNVIPILEIEKYFKGFVFKPGLGSGFGSFTFHPEFKTNGLFYTSHTELSDPKLPADFTYSDSIPKKIRYILTEWKVQDSDKMEFTEAKRELLSVDMVTVIHGMQEITFNPTAIKGEEDFGKLYIGIGDGGSAQQKYTSLTQDKSKIWGTILRIDPLGDNSENGNYGIPIDNPFFADNDAHGEIWAYGFRNPHRITWDEKNGNMLASEIGQNQIEELNLIEKGKNYGWPKREGTFQMFTDTDMKYVYPLKNDEKDLFTYPVLQFDHDEANAICGGFVYYGENMPALKGKYIFGTITKGRIFMSNAKDFQLGQQVKIEELNIAINDTVTSLKTLTGSKRVDFRIDRDAYGELYLFTKYDGKIYKVIGLE